MIKNNKTLITTIYLAAILLAAYILFERGMFFEQMMHNIDLVFNMVKNPMVLESGVDWYAVDKFISLKDLWIVSMTALRSLPFIFVFAGFIIGFSTAGLINVSEDNNGERRFRTKSFKAFKGKKSKVKKR